MYDMYRWNQPAGSLDTTAPAAPGRRSRTGNGPRRRPAEAAQAVQEALDRRDNGGAPAASGDR